MTGPSKVLELLYDRRDGAWSRQDLAAAAGISVADLNDVVADLTGRGFRLDESPTQGIQLLHPTPLDAHLIERDLPTERLGRNVIVFGEVNSTNDVAADSARQAGSDGLVVLAEHQRRGRGRLGRSWLSEAGQNILMSVLLTSGAESLRHDAVTVATGLAVAEGIEDICGSLPCQLRWPNDVLVGGRKVAGVLVEIRHNAAGPSVVLGVGINANTSPPAGLVDRPATALAEQTGRPTDRIEVIRAVLIRLDGWLSRLADGQIDALHDGWVGRCGMINDRVTVLSRGRSHVGRVLDVSPLEGLILVCDDGRREHVPAEGASLAG